MIKLSISIIALLLVGTLLAGVVGCQHESVLSEDEVRELATRYRDDWLTKNPSEETAVLARGTIRSVERLTNVWHVVFVTETGHDPNTPEGMHDYFLHVYLKLSGKLERIERGPDILS